jgi:hypothetical protein
MSAVQIKTCSATCRQQLTLKQKEEYQRLAKERIDLYETYKLDKKKAQLISF